MFGPHQDDPEAGPADGQRFNEVRAALHALHAPPPWAAAAPGGAVAPKRPKLELASELSLCLSLCLAAVNSLKSGRGEQHRAGLPSSPPWPFCAALPPPAAGARGAGPVRQGHHEQEGVGGDGQGKAGARRAAGVAGRAGPGWPPCDWLPLAHTLLADYEVAALRLHRTQQGQAAVMPSGDERLLASRSQLSRPCPPPCGCPGRRTCGTARRACWAWRPPGRRWRPRCRGRRSRGASLTGRATAR